MNKNVLFQELNGSILKEKGVQLIIKREDRFFPKIPGNKWRKLRYNLEKAKKGNFGRIISFGGAYSNHISALADAGRIFGIPTLGIIRGEQVLPLNPSLAAAKASGMQFDFTSRAIYRLLTREKDYKQLRQKYPNSYIIPEGGTNALAVQGCSEIISELPSIQEYDYYCCPVGTAGTIAGILCGLNGKQQVIGFPALKGDFLKQEIDSLTNTYQQSIYSNYTLSTIYHFGGYAKFDAKLIQFINKFKHEYAIQLDPIYTGKMFYGLFDMIKKDQFKPGTKILAIHTGGQQGIAGFNDRHGDIIT